MFLSGDVFTARFLLKTLNPVLCSRVEFHPKLPKQTSSPNMFLCKERSED